MPNLGSTSLGVGARCHAAGSIRQALNRAVTLVGREFSSLEFSCQVRFRGSDCPSLRAEWGSRKATLLSTVREESVRRTLTQVLKSCDRFFDVECRTCDKKASVRARSDWQRLVAAEPEHDPASPASWSEDPLGELAKRVERLVSTKWGERMKEYRQRFLVPDQNGCFETPRGNGGTLGTASSEFSEDLYGLRVGTVKTKGKFRVVTMQTARVKGLLKPVHECLYDFLSCRKWLVRGDFLAEHAKTIVADREPGEDFVSGDYSAATNNIYLKAVSCIIGVLARCPDLTEEEREVMVGSFDAENLHWVSSSGISHPIRRGSMMGNLLSFPVLCLLNKACYDIVSSMRRKRTGVKRYRKVLINGDDIAFAGNSAVYEDWVAVTSHFGLVVNRDKTGVSSEYIELNSRSYHVTRNRLLRKPVLSALQPLNSDTSCLLSRLYEGLRTLSPGNFRWMVVMLRYDIIRRGVTLSSVPSRLRCVLLRERWFRQAVQAKPLIVESGVKRAWPVVTRDVGPSPLFWALYDERKVDFLRLGVRLTRGLKVRPYEKRLASGPLLVERDAELGPRLGESVLSFRVDWEWNWPAPLWDWWEARGLPVVPLVGRWLDDHPDLSVGVSLVRSLNSFPPPRCLLLDAVRPDGVNWV